MRVIDRRCSGRGYVFQGFNLSTFLYIICEISTRAEFHDEVDILLGTLNGMVNKSQLEYHRNLDTYNDVNELRNMAVGERFEDFDLTLKVVKEPRGEITSAESLNRNLLFRGLLRVLVRCTRT